jgi:uncharacterized sulfatase
MGRTIPLLGLLFLPLAAAGAAPPDRPNLVFILADDLGYGDAGCYGQKVIATPRIDRMAAEGLRFTQFYAGSTVCAPSRCVLMTGLHLGRAHVRGNAAGLAQSLRDEDVTVAEVLKGAGYATALVGKWGLGESDHPGFPLKQGFDHFFGYLNQTHAHNYYPEFLWRNGEKVALKNVVKKPEKNPDSPGGWATAKAEYSHDLIAEEAFRWVRARRDGPFFLYFAVTLPHANNEAAGALGNGAEVPDLGEYADMDWPAPDKGHAAMISRLDRDVGRMLDLLKELGIAEKTLVFFTSDNGPHSESRQDLKRFNPSGPLRGIKRDLYEGGIRVPAIAWWPGTVRPGLSDHVGYFGDFMATAGEIAGAKIPDGLDSISFLPALRGERDRQEKHPFLYWEFYEQGSRQAVRQGDWKAVRRPMFTGKTELYDLSADPGEEKDVSAAHPEVVGRMEALMKEAHVPHPGWKVPAPRRPK